MGGKGAENDNNTALTILEIGDEKEMMAGREEEAEKDKEPGLLIPESWQTQLQTPQLVLFPFTDGRPSQLPHY